MGMLMCSRLLYTLVLRVRSYIIIDFGEGGRVLRQAVDRRRRGWKNNGYST